MGEHLGEIDPKTGRQAVYDYTKIVHCLQPATTSTSPGCAGSHATCSCNCAGCNGRTWRDVAGVATENETIAVRTNVLRAWAMRAKSAQIALDLSKDPEDVAIRAGQLQDLAEEILRVVDPSAGGAVGAAVLHLRAVYSSSPCCILCGTLLETIDEWTPDLREHAASPRRCSPGAMSFAPKPPQGARSDRSF